MTTYNKATLKTFFETNDTPGGSDYANLIDSQVNLVETAGQSMAGPLQTTELATSRVSAGNVNATGTMTIAGQTSAAGLNLTGDVSANAGSVYASAMRVASGYYQLPVIISAAGTSQATGASMGTNGIVRAKGIVDGSTTGFTLLANLTGFEQTIWVEENTSCNLWPCVGGQINALSSNAAFGMTGNTKYVVTHIKASGYAVK